MKDHRKERAEARKKAEKLVSQMTLLEKASQLKYDAAPVKRLGVPAYNYWNEALHGVARAGVATMFPQAIAMAAVFDHEADHALEHKTNTQEYEVNRARGSDSQYQTKEERRVITGSEQKTSRANGETRSGQVTRRNHNGKTVITKGVTSNVIDRQKTQEYEKRNKAVWTSEP